MGEKKVKKQTTDADKAAAERQSCVRNKARGQASRQQACGSLRAEPSITKAQNQSQQRTIKAKQTSEKAIRAELLEECQGNKARGQASRQQACGSLRAEPSITKAQNQSQQRTIKAKQTSEKAGGRQTFRANIVPARTKLSRNNDRPRQPAEQRSVFGGRSAVPTDRMPFNAAGCTAGMSTLTQVPAQTPHPNPSQGRGSCPCRGAIFVAAPKIARGRSLSASGFVIGYNNAHARKLATARFFGRKLALLLMFVMVVALHLGD